MDVTGMIRPPKPGRTRRATFGDTAIELRGLDEDEVDVVDIGTCTKNGWTKKDGTPIPAGLWFLWTNPRTNNARGYVLPNEDGTWEAYRRRHRGGPVWIGTLITFEAAVVALVNDYATLYQLRPADVVER